MCAGAHTRTHTHTHTHTQEQHVSDHDKDQWSSSGGALGAIAPSSRKSLSFFKNVKIKLDYL